MPEMSPRTARGSGLKRQGAFLLLLLCLSFPAARGEEPGLYDYILTDQEGKEVTLAPYRGRILVLEFFATWCPPCKKDLPRTASLQEKYPTNKVTFLAVSADGASDTAQMVPRFVEEMGLKIPVLVGGALFIDRYAGIEERAGKRIVLPQTYVFGGDGEMLLRLVGDQKTKVKQLAAELDQILKEAAS